MDKFAAGLEGRACAVLKGSEDNGIGGWRGMDTVQ
mgnify:CR=1 FL=1